MNLMALTFTGCQSKGDTLGQSSCPDGDDFQTVANFEPNKEGLFLCHLCEFTGK